MVMYIENWCTFRLPGYRSITGTWCGCMWEIIIKNKTIVCYKELRIGHVNSLTLTYTHTYVCVHMSVPNLT